MLRRDLDVNQNMELLVSKSKVVASLMEVYKLAGVEGLTDCMLDAMKAVIPPNAEGKSTCIGQNVRVDVYIGELNAD